MNFHKCPKWFSIFFLILFTILVVAVIIIACSHIHTEAEYSVKVPDIPILIATIALVVVTAIYAVFTYKISKSTSGGVKAKILISLVKDYGNKSMGEAVDYLWSKYREYKDEKMEEKFEELGKKYIEKLRSSSETRELDDNDRTFIEWDAKRREVSHYYVMADKLIDDDKLITSTEMEAIIDKNQVEIVEKIILKLDTVKAKITGDPKPEPYSFSKVRGLHKKEGNDQTKTKEQ